MEQINTYWVYLLGKWLDSVFLHARMPLSANIFAWQSAMDALDFLIMQGPGRGEFGLKESVQDAIQLSMKLKTYLTRFKDDPASRLTEAEATQLQQMIGLFEYAMARDLARLPTYFVTDKGIYSTERLIRLAEWIILPELRNAQVIPDLALKDLNQAGGCLAFGMATASGFHSARAVERILREYYVLATGLSVIPSKKDPNGKPIEKSNMYDVISALRASGKGNDKTLATLDQLRDLHRNPIGHPEVFLEAAEAYELFTICATAISSVARQMIVLKKQTRTP